VWSRKDSRQFLQSKGDQLWNTVNAVQVLPRPKEEEMTKDQILEALPGTGIEIAKRLEVSPVLVNAHLQQLKRMGKVIHKEAVKNGRGRPSFIWILPEAQN
jgi:predicted ArsR family transcriptional regulator